MRSGRDPAWVSYTGTAGLSRESPKKFVGPLLRSHLPVSDFGKQGDEEPPGLGSQGACAFKGLLFEARARVGVDQAEQADWPIAVVADGTHDGEWATTEAIRAAHPVHDGRVFQFFVSWGDPSVPVLPVTGYSGFPADGSTVS